MEREKPTFDILGRIEQERLSRGWSEYALAENSGLTQSTISTWRRRNLQPNVASIEKICAGFYQAHISYNLFSSILNRKRLQTFLFTGKVDFPSIPPAISPGLCFRWPP